MLDKLRQLRFRNFTGQEHSAGLAANGAAADHPFPQSKIVLRPEVGFHQRLQPGVLCHGTANDQLLGFLCKAALSVLHLRHGKETIVAVEVLILAAERQLLLNLIVPAHTDAVGYHRKILRAFFQAMGQKHLLRVAVPNLHGVQVDVFIVGIYIQQQLGGIPYPRNGVKGMPSPNQREVGNCVQFKQIGAGHTEKVTHHQIRIPHGLQFRQAVEHIECVPSLPGNLFMNRYCECFKSLIGIKPTHLYPTEVSQNRLMLGESNIHNIPAISHCLAGKGFREDSELFQFRYLPDHIVAEPDKVQNIVHLGKAAENFIKRCHTVCLPTKKAGQ